jgi:hypothetical protein
VTTCGGAPAADRVVTQTTVDGAGVPVLIGYTLLSKLIGSQALNVRRDSLATGVMTGRPCRLPQGASVWRDPSGLAGFARFLQLA